MSALAQVEKLSYGCDVRMIGLRMSKTTLFVYGTLMSGQSNNHRMAEQDLVGPARTLPIYRLFGLGWHPGLMLDREHGLSVHGELWSVDEATLATLDEYEGVPHYFTREHIAIADIVGDVQAYFYAGQVAADAPSGDRWPLPK